MSLDKGTKQARDEKRDRHSIRNTILQDLLDE